jgi:hypothetical protein
MESQHQTIKAIQHTQVMKILRIHRDDHAKKTAKRSPAWRQVRVDGQPHTLTPPSYHKLSQDEEASISQIAINISDI